MIPDYLYYGKWHILALNFVMFNIIEGKAEYFGSAPPMAYIDGYIPDHMGLLYPFAAIGLVGILWAFIKDKRLVVPLTLIMNLLIYSLTGHKETRYIMHITPYILICGGYGFAILYENYKILRKVLGMIFYLIIFVNMILYVIKVGGRPHTFKAYNRLLEVHDVKQPAKFGLFTDCFFAPHNILLHNTNLTFRTTDCMPTITRDNPHTVMDPLMELYTDFLQGMEKKSDFEKLDYFIVNGNFLRYNFLNHLLQNYDLVGVTKIGRHFEYPLRYVNWDSVLRELSEYYMLYLFKKKP